MNKAVGGQMSTELAEFFVDIWEKFWFNEQRDEKKSSKNGTPYKRVSEMMQVLVKDIFFHGQESPQEQKLQPQNWFSCSLCYNFGGSCSRPVSFLVNVNVKAVPV